jgi:acetyltransferase-like isoleucine patch superfamily enzyme
LKNAWRGEKFYMRRLLVLIKNILSLPKRLLCTKIALFVVLQDAQVDKKAAIYSGTKFYRSSIGRYSYIGRNCFITDATIGAFTSIAGDCYIGGTPHPLDWVSTSSVFHKWENVFKKNFARHEFQIFYPTIIGNDVWIGERAMIKPGLTIGDGAVIGMGSVVTKDVGPYEIWAGNPARLIRKRFDEETIETLLKTKWWEKSEDEIQALAPHMTNAEEFIREVEGK